MRRMIQFISHYTERYSYIDSIQIALDGGCQWIQLRMKMESLSPFPTPEEEARYMDTLRNTAQQAQQMCKRYGATFIINDHVSLVKEIGADGVHLGKKDMPVSKARRILGKEFIIGGTANTFEDVKMHYQASADYIGLGPFRFTTTKQGLSPILGLEGYRTIIQKMDEAGIHIPIVSIGGITADDIPSILQTGVTGIALSGTVLRAENPVREMARLMEIVNFNSLR